MRLIIGDSLTVLKTLPDNSAQTCITSPPYWGLRDYGVAGQLGLEATPQLFVEAMAQVFREVRRVLRDDGTLWLNLGDSYSQSGRGGNSAAITGRGKDASAAVQRTQCVKPKDLLGIPWRVALALQADGWWLRRDIIWHKPNPMPESVSDRPTTAHEYLFLLTKRSHYYYNAASIAERCSENTHARIARAKPERVEVRNKRSVWTVGSQGFKGAHFATFPPKLIEPCVLAGAPAGGLVLDPFAGTCTTGYVAAAHGRDFVGIEINREYAKLGTRRVPGLQVE